MIFTYDPARMHPQLAEQGYAHLRGVLSEDFVETLRAFYRDSVATAGREARDWKITGKKRQFVFDFPSAEMAEEFRRGLAGLTGIDPARFTISERHLKIYDDAAAPWPRPHKDRAASQFSIGLPVHVPEGSSVCIFPGLDRSPNPGERAIFMDPQECPDPEALYASPEAVLLNEQPGDIVIFLGSALWHERVRPAGTAVLYVKINDLGEDPLGENIYAGAPQPA